MTNAKKDAIDIAAEALDRVAAARHNGKPLRLEDTQTAHDIKQWALSLGATEDEIQAARKH